MMPFPMLYFVGLSNYGLQHRSNVSYVLPKGNDIIAHGDVLRRCVFATTNVGFSMALRVVTKPRLSMDVRV